MEQGLQSASARAIVGRWKNPMTAGGRGAKRRERRAPFTAGFITVRVAPPET